MNEVAFTGLSFALGAPLLSMPHALASFGSMGIIPRREATSSGSTCGAQSGAFVER